MAMMNLHLAAKTARDGETMNGLTTIENSYQLRPDRTIAASNLAGSARKMIPRL
jgi:hypothetical protein